MLIEIRLENVYQNSVHRNVTFKLLPCTKWGITIETLVSRYHITQESYKDYGTSNRIVIVKRKYIFDVETPPHRAICTLMRHFKPMEAVSFAWFNNATVSRFRVTY